MKKTNFPISIIGGDQRQVYLTDFLIKAGYPVITYGLAPYLINKNCIIASSLSEAMKKGSIIIGGIPLSRDGKMLLTSDSISITLEDFLSHLTKKQFLIAGSFHYTAIDYCTDHSISYYDLMKDNTIAILNGVATGEGAIMKAIEKSSVILHQHKCLVMGFGRCGQILASRLKGLGAFVSISGRNPELLPICSTNGYDFILLPEIKEHLSSFDFIFNTIPYPVLGKNLLEKVSLDTTIIDIASAPGGIDYNAARELGINATLFLGIPGKTAPKTSAEIIGNKMIELIERGTINDTKP